VREYEFIYIIQPDATSEREAEIHSKVDEVVSRAGATHLLRDDWGKRKLAYEIRKFQKGHYFQVNFLGDGSFVPDLERMLRLDGDVLRFLTVMADENVKDIDARIAKARQHEAEQARRREERERLEAERVAREVDLAREADEVDAISTDGLPVEDELDADVDELDEMSVEEGPIEKDPEAEPEAADEPVEKPE
jgi:small subunit ribosomal protein S6